MDSDTVRKFRENLRVFERELDIQNNSGCSCGVTLSQCHALMELSKTNNITLSQLSEKLSLDKSTVSRTVESLVNNELITRTIPKENRRITKLTLTKMGIAVCKQINTGNDDYYEKALNSIPDVELPVFFKSFETLVNYMKKVNSDMNSIAKIIDYK